MAAWLAKDKDGTEALFMYKPYRRVLTNDWKARNCAKVIIPKGNIKKLIGHNLKWKDEPVKIG